MGVALSGFSECHDGDESQSAEQKHQEIRFRHWTHAIVGIFITPSGGRIPIRDLGAQKCVVEVNLVVKRDRVTPIPFKCRGKVELPAVGALEEHAGAGDAPAGGLCC